MAKNSILAASLFDSFAVLCLLSLSGLIACDGTLRKPKNSPSQLGDLSDSAVVRSYRVTLAQLAKADQADRQTIFLVFRRHGFRSSQADTANRWLMGRDSLRLATFRVLERRYGWPRAKLVGTASVQQAYLLVQHAPDRVQASYQDTLQAAYARGELRSQDYATYLDRVLMNQGQLQRYGTQSGRHVLANGQEEDYLLPTEDLPRLDQRRATMQLEPLLPQLRPGTTILKPITN